MRTSSAVLRARRASSSALLFALRVSILRSSSMSFWSGISRLTALHLPPSVQRSIQVALRVPATAADADRRDGRVDAEQVDRVQSQIERDVSHRSPADIAGE